MGKSDMSMMKEMDTKWILRLTGVVVLWSWTKQSCLKNRNLFSSFFISSGRKFLAAETLRLVSSDLRRSGKVFGRNLKIRFHGNKVANIFFQ